MPAAAKKKESKYVTCFADSRADVDITFRDVLLSRPTDNCLVGIDNFSMTNTNLSMIEPILVTSISTFIIFNCIGLSILHLLIIYIHTIFILFNHA